MAPTTLRFYQVARGASPPKTAKYPCVTFDKDNTWNDFNFYTLYHARFYNDRGALLKKADIKILQVDTNGDTDALRSTTIPDNFLNLSSHYCSLGQDLDYYVFIRKAFGDHLSNQYFSALQDAAMNHEIGQSWMNVGGFGRSLIRFSEAEKAFNEARRILGGRGGQNNTFVFQFSCKVEGADEPHIVNFDFSPHPTSLHRTTVIIGRNGTGKTQFLAQFAHALSGLKGQSEDDLGFRPKRPSFSKVIAVSYSVFDDFARPTDKNPTFSYKYCGIRAPEMAETVRRKSQGAPVKEEREPKFLSSAQIRSRLEKAKKVIIDRNRATQWTSVLSILLADVKDSIDITLDDFEFYKNLSSGQRILVTIMTDIVSEIENESIILFDEPEIHLHPDILSALARSIDRLLEAFNSYAIIATHAPLVLQETLSRQVRIFTRIGSVPHVEKLNRECFGENLSVITDEILGFGSTSFNYKEHINRLLADFEVNEIEGLFPFGLSISAQAYLRTKE